MVATMEEWRALPERFGPHYEVSSLGRVRRVTSGTGLCQAGRVLLPAKTRNGYIKVTIYPGDGRQLYPTIHRLVAEAFLPQSTKRMTPNHKDGDKANNRVENLEWCSPSENIRHAYRNGLAHGCKGSHNGSSKLTEESVVEIHGLLAQGMNQYDIASRFGVAQTQISMIKRGKTWRHVSTRYLPAW